MKTESSVIVVFYNLFSLLTLKIRALSLPRPNMAK